MSITVRKPGILTTVQDLGRTGYTRLGVNPSGVLDRAAARILNVIVGNNESAALLETHFPAVEIEFNSKQFIAVGGADFHPSINGKEILNWKVYSVAKGDVLKFRSKLSGNRAYVAISGGLKVSQWLESSSTNLRAAAGGFEGRTLKPGDVIKIAKSGFCRPLGGKAASPTLLPPYGTGPTVRVLDGPEGFLLTAKTKELLTSSAFKISPQSDRMGFRLSGPGITQKKKYEMVTSAAAYGTVQLLPDGQLVVLMADHQTTGGYPRIATVIDADLPLIAQLGAGDRVSFSYVTVEDAEDAALRFERDLKLLKLALQSC